MITLVKNKKTTFQVRLGDVVEIQNVANRCVVLDLQMFPKSRKYVMKCCVYSSLTTFRYNVHYVELKPDEALEDQVGLKMTSCTKILSVGGSIHSDEESYLVEFLQILDSEVYRYVTYLISNLLTTSSVLYGNMRLTHLKLALPCWSSPVLLEGPS